MTRPVSTKPNEIKKRKLQEVAQFAVNNIPQVDPTTLKQFLELANAGGNYDSISHQQIIKRMHQVLKYVPGASANSLLILTDLLEIDLSKHLFLNSAEVGRLGSGVQKNGQRPFIIETPKSIIRGSDVFR